MLLTQVYMRDRIMHLAQVARCWIKYNQNKCIKVCMAHQT